MNYTNTEDFCVIMVATALVVDYVEKVFRRDFWTQTW